MEGDMQKRELHIMPPDMVVKAATIALGMLALFLFIAALSELRAFRYIGTGVPATNTITVTGMGEVFAVPDLATFSVSVREEALEVADAQETAADKMNTIIAYLQQQGVEEKDIKTVSYNVYPRYEWQQAPCPADSRICPPGKSVMTGFEVHQTISVKVRDTERAGDLLSGVGSRGASDVSGLTFTTDDDDALRAEARALAIEDARGKAAELANSLNVRLVRIVGFHESDYGYPPMPYAYGMGGDMMVRSEAAMKAPELPVGENKIVSNVSVTYEIR
ncbi:hypothetical protein COU20_00775 [Candidatus Kaiserbacteria bacterium CG10_big_fil_rev_8_21_14_0_10_59_10]|uniref:SIMPL domain-containing protein n=1 Tax=Candidatus Kaiserbacteria bacterium CG10_big_fil_rev_8_21_14_0_10_59_10 TaxID=1974612 RepID=A0A2H0U8G1_9BACT|nr:MAG: hypothetical protein COU20_00775 [Candidatus Kaiserbacteria bacterium CG10_big_fil_rev_8_21_14_0_10_59_10]